MIYLNLGRRENGKSTLAYYMAAKKPRRLILDARQDFRRPGALIARTDEQLDYALQLLAEGTVQEVVYSPAYSPDEKNPLYAAGYLFAEHVARWVMEHPRLPLVVIIDEISFYDLSAGPLQWGMKTSRRDTMDFILTGHRPSDVPVDIRTIADYWFFFRVTQEHDLDVVRQKCRGPIVELVQQLPDRHYLMWNDTNATHAIGDDPDLWFVELKPHGAQVIDLDGRPDLR